MYGNINLNNKLIKTIDELFVDQISGDPLSFAIFWKPHTFSKKTINQLTVFYDFHVGANYISQPYTREIFYLDNSKKLPENTIINDLILVFSYCKSIKLTTRTFKNILIYFLKILLKQHKNSSNSIYLLGDKKEIQDLLIKKLAEILGCTNDIIEILFTGKYSKKLIRPCPIRLNAILHLAIKQNNHRISSLLLSKKFKINLELKDRKEKTLLYWAVYHKQQIIAIKLLKLGANPDPEDSNKITPLFWACINDQEELVVELIRYGANVNHRDVNGQTPLFWSCNHNKYKMTELILANNANINIKDLKNNTPLEIAYNKQDLLLVKILKNSNKAYNGILKDQYVSNKMLIWDYNQQNKESNNNRTKSNLILNNSYRYTPY